MIGKINYKSGALIQLDTYSQLPPVGSESVLYYIREENTYYTYNESTNKYTSLKTKGTSWIISDEQNLLDEIIGNTVNVQSDLLTSLEGGTLQPAVGDLVSDISGTIGIITEVDSKTGACTIKTLESSVPRKVTYENNSWEMWLPKEEGGGHYYWDSTTNILTYEGPYKKETPEENTPITWETFSILGGGPNYTISGGSRVGTRKFLAWDSGTKGEGTLRLYYTKNKSDHDFVENDEVATLEEVYKIFTSTSGIYCGHSNTLNTLEQGEIEGYPEGHKLSSNDWAYVMHYDENSQLYTEGASYAVDDIIEYNGLLYKVIAPFIATTWGNDSQNTLTWDGDTWSFIYRDEIGWTRGTKIDSDNFEPDEQRLTTTTNNKMTIKTGGVDTQSLADQAVTNNKLSTSAVTTDKIADGQITRDKLDTDLTELATRGDTMWYSGNLVVSDKQPAAPENGYIIWINTNTDSI